MRKEKLLEKKQKVLENMLWYGRHVMTEDDLKNFSIHQLELMCDIMNRAEDYRESCEPFYSLSACEVIHKKSGKIAYFEDSGLIREEMEEEVMQGAARPIYEDYKRKRG